MEVALRTLHQGNVNIRVLQETHLTQGICTQHRSGYDVWATEVRVNISGVEREGRMAGRGLCQLWPKRGKFMGDDKAAEIVRRQGIHSPKQQSHYHASGTYSTEIKELRGGNTDGGYQLEDTRTEQRAGRRT